jgi:hypothetical protein
MAATVCPQVFYLIHPWRIELYSIPQLTLSHAVLFARRGLNMRIRIYDIGDDGSEIPLGVFSDAEILEIDDSAFFSAALKVLTEEGEALASLDGRSILLRWVRR